MTLHDYIHAHHRFRWGGVNGNDCMTFAARWVELATGIDPIPHLRGSYSDAEGANRIVTRAGGLVSLAANVLESIGFERTHAPKDGDVAIILAPAGFAIGDITIKEIAAIRFGPCWAAIGPGGVISKRADFVAAWRILSDV